MPEVGTSAGYAWWQFPLSSPCVGEKGIVRLLAFSPKSVTCPVLCDSFFALGLGFPQCVE